MRALVYGRYGSPDALEMGDVPKPAPKPDQLLVRVHAASVNRSDWEMLTAHPAYVRLSGAGFRAPKRSILGSDVSGTVEAVGADVGEFQPGDEVFGDVIYAGMGAFAEYLVVAADAPIVRKPPRLSHADAAALPQAAGLALQGLRDKLHVASGHHVLINGAGGGGGTMALQIAKSMGAEVTAVDSAAKQEAMRALGADRVIDYAGEDPLRGARYDRILDFVGNRSILAHRRALTPGGGYAMVGGSVPRLLETLTLGAAISRTTDKDMGLLVAKPAKAHLLDAAAMVEAGELAPVIDDTYPLAGVPEAMRALGAGEVVGKAVIAI